MDIEAVREGMAAVARTVEVPGASLTASPWIPESIHAPMFFVGEMDIDFDRAMGRGLDSLLASCRLLVARTDSRSAQRQLDALISGGPGGIKAAFDADPTLGGACDFAHLRRIEAHRYFQFGKTDYLGAQIDIYVIGSGS